MKVGFCCDRSPVIKFKVNSLFDTLKVGGYFANWPGFIILSPAAMLFTIVVISLFPDAIVTSYINLFQAWNPLIRFPPAFKTYPFSSPVPSFSPIPSTLFFTSYSSLHSAAIPSPSMTRHFPLALCQPFSHLLISFLSHPPASIPPVCPLIYHFTLNLHSTPKSSSSL